MKKTSRNCEKLSALLEKHTCRPLGSAPLKNGGITGTVRPYISPIGFIFVVDYDAGGWEVFVPASPNSVRIDDTIGALQGMLEKAAP